MAGEEGFKAYDFAADARWAEFLNNVTASGPDDAAVTLKLKQRFYRSRVDPTYVAPAAPASGAQPRPAAAASSARADPPPASTSRPTAGAAAPPPPRPSGAPPPAASASAAGGRKRPALETAMFLGNAWVIMFSIAALLAAVLRPRLMTFIYKLAVASAAFTYAGSIYAARGLPPLTLSAGQAWMAPIADSSDFLALFFCLIFLPLPRTYLLVMLPLCIGATYQVMGYLSRHFAGLWLWRALLAPRHAYLLARQPDALALCAASEIGLAASLLLQMLSPSRSILTLFVLVNFLKMRYAATCSREPHRRVWAVIGQRVEPLLRAVPAAAPVVGYLQRWFTAVPGGQ